MHSIYNTISSSILLAYFVPLFLTIYKSDLRQLKGFVGVFTTTFFVDILKLHVIGTSDPRPAGARDCNLFNTDGPQSGAPGMPSGHAATAAFFAAYYFKELSNVYVRILLLAYAALIIYSRYIKRCHTISQLLVGTAIGIAGSYFFHKIRIWFLTASISLLKKQCMMKDIWTVYPYLICTAL